MSEREPFGHVFWTPEGSTEEQALGPIYKPEIVPPRGHGTIRLQRPAGHPAWRSGSWTIRDVGPTSKVVFDPIGGTCGTTRRDDLTVNRTGFDYEVRAVFEMSEIDLDFLIELSKTHYDSTCKRIGVPGYGAFLNGMKNTVENGVAKGRLTSRELNLVLKVLEMPHNRPDLIEAFIDLFKSVAKESERVNA